MLPKIAASWLNTVNVVKAVCVFVYYYYAKWQHRQE